MASSGDVVVVENPAAFVAAVVCKEKGTSPLVGECVLCVLLPRPLVCVRQITRRGKLFFVLDQDEISRHQRFSTFIKFVLEMDI